MNQPQTHYDARCVSSTTQYDPDTGLLQYKADNDGVSTVYTYDESRALTEARTAAGDKAYRNEYTYTDGEHRLAEARHNTGSDTAYDVAYRFTYDALGNRTEARVGNQLLSRNIYTETGDKLLECVEYGNGAKASYVRDEFKRVTGIRYDEEPEPRYTYAFDAGGNAAKVTDHALNRTTATEYDLCNRPMKTRQMEGDNHLFTMELAYDGCNRVSQVTERVGEAYTTYTNGYTYDVENKITGVSFGENAGATFTYDGLGRVTSRTLKNSGTGIPSAYTYVKGGYGETSTTPLVEKVSNPGQEIHYAYDRQNRIESVTCNGVKTGYIYDKLSQLIRVDDAGQNKTFTYTYDRGGNILSKSEYAYTTASTLGKATKTVAYAYGDSNWKDKLTAYNGQTITYDEIGNPLSDGTWQYSWQVGRQLARIQSANENVDFAYDANGLRVQKTSTTRGTTRYTLQGKRIVHMTRGNVKMHFWYCGQGSPSMVSYNGKDYYYLTNAQGDVLALLDKENNQEVVSYTYDTWGKQISCEGSMADTLGKENLFRYRGYVYDEETGWYYLRSRYYNPEWGRFVNADCLLVRNSFAYCNNNPVMKIDPDGMRLADIDEMSKEERAEFLKTHYMNGNPKPQATTSQQAPVEQLSSEEVYNLGLEAQIVTLTDLKTGKSFKIWWNPNFPKDGGYYHSDWAILNEENLRILEEIQGVKEDERFPYDYGARTGTITFDNGRVLAVGFHLNPHGGSAGGGIEVKGTDSKKEDGKQVKDANNNRIFVDSSGHFCLYYGNSIGGTPKCNDAADAAFDLFP